jgi:uncharacterized radical SAM protein YgiQ
MAANPEFSGVVSDIGGPTANMYGMRCGSPQAERTCRRTSCLCPSICKLLDTDHGPLIELMRDARQQKGVRQVAVASGVRMDLARRSKEYVKELAQHHTSGLLKVAPEHVDPEVLRLMKKPPAEDFAAFAQQFQEAAAEAGKEQYLVPYFMAGHPGCDLDAMIRLAQFLKRTGYRPDKVQDFIPLPMDLATCMYYTGVDPMTGQPVYVPRGGRERRLQRALLQFWKPENYADVRAALVEAGRQDLIGEGPECLISARSPKGKSTECIESSPRSRGKATGYRPHRKSADHRRRGP